MQRADSTMTASTTGENPSTGRRVAFRVVLALVSLLLLAALAFGLLELVLMWLPAESLAGMFDEEASDLTLHRTHFLAIGVNAWAMVLALSVQWRKPERRIAPMLLLIAAAIGGTIVYGLSGTLSEWLVEEIATIAIPIALLAVLHPGRDRLFQRPDFDRPMLGLSALAGFPWLVYIVDNARTQFVDLAGDPHAEPEHWATAALMGILLAVAAFLGSSTHPGWRLTGWIASGGTFVFAAHSLVFPGLASALPGFWAIAAVVWSVAFAVALVRRPASEATPGQTDVSVTSDADHDRSP